MGHARRVSEVPGEDLRSSLRQLGLIELSGEKWMNSPETQSAQEHFHQVKARLKPAVGSLAGLRILNPRLTVRFYPDRWEEAKNQSGGFVARRPQAYGNDLWCYIELDEGRPQSIVEFPSPGTRWRGCDEAWHLQMAIDANQGAPQLYRVTEGSNGSQIIQFFSPVPMWARRRWDTIGQLGPRFGCLFSYSFLPSDIPEEINYIERRLWLAGASN